jgi:hypothetical protein
MARLFYRDELLAQLAYYQPALRASVADVYLLAGEAGDAAREGPR